MIFCSREFVALQAELHCLHTSYRPRLTSTFIRADILYYDASS